MVLYFFGMGCLSLVEECDALFSDHHVLRSDGFPSHYDEHNRFDL